MVDDLYYFKDLLSVGEYRLKKSVLQNLLNWLVFPALLPVSKLRKQNVSYASFYDLCLLVFIMVLHDLFLLTVESYVILVNTLYAYTYFLEAVVEITLFLWRQGPSVITSLYMVTGLLQVVGGEALVNFVAIIVLYPFLVAEITDASRKNKTSISSDAKSLLSYMSELEGLVCSDLEGGENINGDSSLRQLIGCGTSNNLSISLSEAATSTGRYSYRFVLMFSL